MAQTQPTQTAAAAAGGCGCSFFSCCAGCFATMFLGGLLVFGGLVAGYYYLPGYIENKVIQARKANTAATTQIFATAKRDPAALPSLERKVKNFTSQANGPEAGPAHLELGEAEVNAWIAANLLREDSPLPLKDAVVSFSGNNLQAAIRANGPALAKIIPDEDSTFTYLKDMLKRTKDLDVTFSAKVAIKKNKVSFQLISGTLGPFQLWPSFVNPLLSKLLAQNKVQLPGLQIEELEIKNGKLHLTVKRES